MTLTLVQSALVFAVSFALTIGVIDYFKNRWGSEYMDNPNGFANCCLAGMAFYIVAGIIVLCWIF